MLSRFKLVTQENNLARKFIRSKLRTNKVGEFLRS